MTTALLKQKEVLGTYLLTSAAAQSCLLTGFTKEAQFEFCGGDVIGTCMLGLSVDDWVVIPVPILWFCPKTLHSVLTLSIDKWAPLIAPQ